MGKSAAPDLGFKALIEAGRRSSDPIEGVQAVFRCDWPLLARVLPMAPLRVLARP